MQRLIHAPESELLIIEEVDVDIREHDVPGFPKYKVYCEECGDKVLDRRKSLLTDKHSAKLVLKVLTTKK